MHESTIFGQLPIPIFSIIQQSPQGVIGARLGYQSIILLPQSTFPQLYLDVRAELFSSFVTTMLFAEEYIEFSDLISTDVTEAKVKSSLLTSISGTEVRDGPISYHVVSGVTLSFLLSFIARPKVS
jgi:hypothetical protein